MSEALDTMKAAAQTSRDVGDVDLDSVGRGVAWSPLPPAAASRDAVA